MSQTPSEVVHEASSLIQERGFTKFIRDAGMGGIFYAVVLAAIAFIQSAGGVIMRPLEALGDGLALLVGELFGGPVRFLGAAWDTAIVSIVEGTASLLGIGAPIAAVAVSFTTLFVATWFITRIDFSPLVFLRNIPILRR